MIHGNLDFPGRGVASGAKRSDGAVAAVRFAAAVLATSSSFDNPFRW
jgi:hypothetical protein